MERWTSKENVSLGFQYRLLVLVINSKKTTVVNCKETHETRRIRVWELREREHSGLHIAV